MNFKQALIAHLQGERVEGNGLMTDEKWGSFADLCKDISIGDVFKDGFGDAYQFRLAPRTVMCNGVEVPAPEKVAPKNGSEYYVANPLNPDGTVRFLCWDGCDFGLKHLELGLVYLNKEDAIARAKAMLIVQEVKVTQWQPIETAPKDGAEFLTYIEGHGCCVAWYCTEIEMFDIGFCHRADLPSDSLYKHWMPLPAPPTT